MAGTIRPNDMNMSTTPTMSSGTLPGLNIQTDVVKKPSAPRTPRIDVEPLYAAVKGAISDTDWITYKKSLSFFLLGNLNQEELTWKLSKILTTPALEHAHNALFTAIYANLWRDAPEPGIASWVSSSDKPTSGTVKGAHDESEKRLKYEVMQLSRRERKRLKTIPAGDGVSAAAPDGALGPAGVGALGPVHELIDARRVKQPEMGPAGGNQGGGFGKTSKYSHVKNILASIFPRGILSKLEDMLTCAFNRLGPRDPQTLYRPSLLGNTRIPNSHYNISPPSTYML